jgi:hypothetical protein
MGVLTGWKVSPWLMRGQKTATLPKDAPTKADVMDQPPSHLFDSMTAPRPRPTLAAAMLVALVAALPFAVLAGVQFLF